MSTVDPEFMPDPDGGDHSPICPWCDGDMYVEICGDCGGLGCEICEHQGEIAYCTFCAKD